MAIRIAINGYGRIGRNILRTLYDNYDSKVQELQIVAINDIGDPKIHAHLTKYDSVYGEFGFPLNYKDNYLWG